MLCVVTHFLLLSEEILVKKRLHLDRMIDIKDE
ncbi:hypothetical protein ABMB67_000406 [Halalkalibacter oceani]